MVEVMSSEAVDGLHVFAAADPGMAGIREDALSLLMIDCAVALAIRRGTTPRTIFEAAWFTFDKQTGWWTDAIAKYQQVCSDRADALLEEDWSKRWDRLPPAPPLKGETP